MIRTPANTTIAEAQEYLRMLADEGVTCPCCEQRVQVYRRSITAAMAHALLLIYRYFETADGWLHVPSYLGASQAIGAGSRGGDWSKLRYWGLLEEKPETRADGSDRAGYYRITALGRRFAEGQERVMKYVFVYNQTIIHRPDDQTETISIEEALGNKFSYATLMNRDVFKDE